MQTDQTSSVATEDRLTDDQWGWTMGFASLSGSRGLHHSLRSDYVPASLKFSLPRLTFRQADNRGRLGHPLFIRCRSVLPPVRAVSRWAVGRSLAKRLARHLPGRFVEVEYKRAGVRIDGVVAGVAVGLNWSVPLL